MSAEMMPAEKAITAHEAAPGLPVDPRIVVFGSFGNAGGLEADLREGLAARELDIAVIQGRLVTNVEDNFFGRRPVAPANMPAVEAAPAKRPGHLARLGSLLTRRREIVTAPAVPEAGTPPGTLPMGVIIFPEMRQYTPDGSTAMDASTPNDKIVGLCETHGVPYVFATRLEEALAGLDTLPLQQALPSASAQDPTA